jgi:phytoene/squalene synthetase
MTDDMNGELTQNLRLHDRNRYLASLFATDDKRASLTALYAYNIELARIRHLVSEPQIGLIRQQWWRDTLFGIYQGEASDHPVAQALAKAIHQHNLPQAPLQAMIDTREFDLYADQMPSLTALETYLGETESAVIQLACLILDPCEAPKAATASGLAGVAYGIARHAANQPNLLPTGMTLEQLLLHAEKRWQEFKQQNPAARLRPAFLHAADTPSRIKRARQGHEISAWRSQWDIWRASRG